MRRRRCRLHRGTGLAGVKDRVEALGGRIFLDSPRDAGTSLHAAFPLTSSLPPKSLPPNP
jgi:signal transduction histidine kinase